MSRVNQQSTLMGRGSEAFPEARAQFKSDKLPNGRASYMPGLISAAKGLESAQFTGYQDEMRATEQVARKRSLISGKDFNKNGVNYISVNNDEVEFVEFAQKTAKYELVQRDQEFIQIKNSLGFVENYDVLADFPFKSN